MTPLVGCAAAVVVLGGLKAVAGIAGPTFLALMLTIAVGPLRARLRRLGAPGWVCVLVPLGTVLTLLLGLAAALAISVAQLTALLPTYSAQFDELLASATGSLARLGVDPERLQTSLSDLDPAKIFGLVGNFFSGVLGVSSAVVIVILMLFSMSLDAGNVSRHLDALLPDRPNLVSALHGFARGTCRYLLVSTLFGLVVAVLDVVALYLFDVPLPLLWGLLAFLTNYIPNVGFVLGLVPPALLGLLSGGPLTMLWIIVIYSVINFVLQSLVQPKVLGQAVGLSVTLTTLSLLVWGWVLGPLGAILAIPLSTLVRALLVDADPARRWAARLVTAGPPERITK